MWLHLGIGLLTAWTLNAQDIGVQKESALGQQLAKDYRLRHAPLDSAAVRDYVEQVGQRLIGAMPNEPPFADRFEPTADFIGTFLEPVSIPGGYVFIPAGLILEARDEAEFADTIWGNPALICSHLQGRKTRAKTVMAPGKFLGEVAGSAATANTRASRTCKRSCLSGGKRQPAGLRIGARGCAGPR
jgi:hypothetical protein